MVLESALFPNKIYLVYEVPRDGSRISVKGAIKVWGFPMLILSYFS